MRPSINELRQQILHAPYPDLEPHAQRGGLIILDSTVDLAQSAWELAQDQKERVEELITKGLLYKASSENIEDWRRQKTFFRFIIIQPFVLAQIMTDFDELKSPQN